LNRFAFQFEWVAKDDVADTIDVAEREEMNVETKPEEVQNTSDKINAATQDENRKTV